MQLNGVLISMQDDVNDNRRDTAFEFLPLKSKYFVKTVAILFQYCSAVVGISRQQPMNQSGIVLTHQRFEQHAFDAKLHKDLLAVLCSMAHAFIRGKLLIQNEDQIFCASLFVDRCVDVKRYTVNLPGNFYRKIHMIINIFCPCT